MGERSGATEGGLEACLAAAGARLRSRGGWAEPADFGDPEGEYRAARDAVALAVLTERGTAEVTGSDRVSFLQGMLTADIAALEPGAGCRALSLTHQGRVVADLRVLAVAERFLLQLDTEVKQRALSHLSSFVVADDVEFSDRTSEVATLALLGPRGSEVLSALGSGVPEQWLAHQVVELTAVPTRIVADRVGDVPCVAILCPRPMAAKLWEALREAGRSCGLRPCGAEALEVLRIEEGVPRMGIDMGEENFALEVGLDDAISSNKGCYLGQEVVERARSRGHINRKLSGLVVEGTELPQPGAAVVADNRQVGRVTSAARSRWLGAVVALAYVRRESWTAGTRVAVVTEGGTLAAQVTSLPFRPAARD